MENTVRKTFYNHPAEKALVGYLLLNEEKQEEIFEKVNPDDFGDTGLGKLYKTLQEIHLSGNNANLITLTDYGYSYEKLEALMMDIPSNFMLEYSINSILKLSNKRKLIKLGEEIKQLVFKEHEPEEIRTYARNQLNLYENEHSIKYAELSKLVANVLDEINEARAKKNNNCLNGLSTGIKALDKATGGMRSEQLIVLAARPSVGKTTFALNMATNQVLEGNAVGFVSLEMTARTLRNKILSSISPIDYNKLRDGYVTDAEIKKITAATDLLLSKNMFFIEPGKIGISEVIKFGRKMKREHDMKALYIDYLGLMVQDGNNRMNEISLITRELKLLSKELGIPVILLSQLNRNLENREDKRPILSDLRDSGSIEQDADIIMFLYRDGYHHQKKTHETNDEIEIIIAKQREGAVSTVKAEFQRQISKFSDVLG